ncbi:MAG: hypothetical protein M9894_28550 [Planctomycetes bacterium]|nr:hypothetical protein [Planctomycetota bacterium]
MRRLVLAFALTLAGCSSNEPEPEPTARALDPAPNPAPIDSPPLGSPRAKLAPEAAMAKGERETIR